MLACMNLNDTSRVHCTGIGGVGMSGLAQLLSVRGKIVSGCDREEQPTTLLLDERGIAVTVGHDAGHISHDTDVLIYSAAIPEDHPERVRARELGIREINYFQALGEVSENMYTIAVSGTHGKTTTTGMLAKILIDAGLSPTVIAGSILKDFGSNFVHGKSDLFIVEACEYRRHFLHLHPSLLIINNIELDHPDYYRDLTDVQEAFNTFARSVPESGVIITNPNDERVAAALSGIACPVVDYTRETIGLLPLPGAHNVANAQAAKAAARALRRGISEEAMNTTLAAFQGTWRRFEFKGKTEQGAMVYDDYAHHPTAIHVTLKAARESFPDRRIVVLFHPHLYSRTKVLFDDFAAGLALADEVFILPIYAAREDFDPSVSSIDLAAAIQKQGAHARPVRTFEEAAELLRQEKEDTLIITMGAGDVYKVADALISYESSSRSGD